MKLKRFFSSGLERKMSVVLIVLLVVTFGIGAVINIVSGKNNMIKQEKEKLDLMAIGLKKSIQDMMLSGNASIVGGWLNDLKDIREVRGLQVLRKDGQEAFHDNTTIQAVNKAMGAQVFQETYGKEEKTEKTLSVDRARLDEALKTGEKVVYFEKLNGEDVMTQLTPILNEERCASCHRYDEHKVRAVLRLSAPTAGINEAINRNIWKTILASLVFIIMTILAIRFFIARLIIKPLKEVVAAVTAVAEGDLRSSINHNSGDEIGALARNVNGMVNSLRVITENIVATSGSVSTSTDALNALTKKTSEGARTQTSQAAYIAAAAEEMSQTITDIARNASTAAETSSGAMDTANKGKEVSDGAVNAVNSVYTSTVELATMIDKLNGRVGEIGNIAGVIKDIADQTNLLALNAAIEAARAGEQGRGFSVVADEVRKLAERTIKATKEISDKINAVQEESEETTRSMGTASEEVTKAAAYIKQVGESLNNIVDAVQRVRDQIIQIATAVDEQSAASEDVAKNIEKTQAVSKDIENMASEVMQEVDGLSIVSDNLKFTIAGFKV